VSWQPLWNAGLIVSAHALAAMFAMGLGAVQLARPKGTETHRWLGRVWVATLGLVAISSFAIYKFKLMGPFSPIHLLSILTLLTLWRSVRAVRRGDITRHRRAMIALYVLALGITGALTLWPGRTMHAVLFGL